MCTKIYEEWACGCVGQKIIETYRCKHYKAAHDYKKDKGVSDQHTTVQLYISRCKAALKARYEAQQIECRVCQATEARRRSNGRRTGD